LWSWRSQKPESTFVGAFRAPLDFDYPGKNGSRQQTVLQNIYAPCTAFVEGNHSPCIRAGIGVTVTPWAGDCDEDARRLLLGTNTPPMVSAAGTLLEQLDAQRATRVPGGQNMTPTDSAPETTAAVRHRGLLIMNADDWGLDRLTTDRTLDCCQLGAVSSVSAMVFMEDSERAAAIARERAIETGLHLNFTTPLSARGAPARLAEHLQRTARHLSRHRLAQTIFHPGLMRSFEYVAEAQLGEFRRLYGAAPDKIDGHHHMHLAANVLMQKLLPQGTVVRRNFSFETGEKSRANQLYRRFVDRSLARRHVLSDYFFALAPLEPASRLRKIFALAGQYAVEVETHPANPDEHRYLSGGEFFRELDAMGLARPSVLRAR
jgi:chitin disaccharide deacetylase